MALTKAQSLLIEYFKSIGMEEQAIIITMVGLKETAHTEQMIDYLIEVKPRTQEQILQAMVDITEPKSK